MQWVLCRKECNLFQCPDVIDKSGFHHERGFQTETLPNSFIFAISNLPKR